MTDDIIDVVPENALAVAASAPAALAVAPPEQSLFGTDDPVVIIERAVRIANALKRVIVAKHLVKNIKGKEYPVVEAWQTLGAMLRLSWPTEWTRKTADGWEARVVVKDRYNNIIGAAENECERSEDRWKHAPGFQIRSMAQTRTTAKALRSVLAFIMVLAGYEPTPAEEMERTQRPTQKNTQPLSYNDEPVAAQAIAAQDKYRDRVRKRVMILCRDLDLSDEDRHHECAERYGEPSTNKLTTEQLIDYGTHLAQQLEESA